MPFSHGDAEAHPPHRTEPEIAGRFRFTRKHAHNGIRLCLGAKSVVLCTISPGNDEEPFFVLAAMISTGDAVALANCVFGVFFALDDHVVCIA